MASAAALFFAVILCFFTFLGAGPLSATKVVQTPVRFSSETTAADGLAPLLSHSSALSPSTWISLGFVSGLYCPMISMKRPSRGEWESATTTR